MEFADGLVCPMGSSAQPLNWSCIDAEISECERNTGFCSNWAFGGTKYAR